MHQIHLMFTYRIYTTALALATVAIAATTAGVGYAQQPTTQPAAAPTTTPPKAAAKAAPKATSDHTKAPPPPWRLARALHTPDWLYFELQQRTRGEYLLHQFRAERPGDGGLLSFRTGIFAELRPDIVRVGVEVMDSRAYLSNDAVALNTTHMNPLALLQAYLGVTVADVAAADDLFTLRAGRITMDIGSRRLMARNRFRNTINTFTGIDAVYRGTNGWQLQAFAVLPIQRKPGTRSELVDNAIVFDRESLDVVHGGVAFTSAPVSSLDITFEGFAFGTFERDGEERKTRNRRLFTPGFRIFRKPKAGAFDFEFESALQLGVSRSSKASDNEKDLDHLAMFQHAAVGYSPRVFAKPRIVLEYDFATGDADRNDDRNGRFETLFGARRFDYGPTGIYGPVARANIRSGGIRLQAKPHALVSGFASYRAFWLAEVADGWTTSGVRAAAGSDATFLGHQIEARVRVNALPGNVRIEPGVAQFFPGEFVDTAANANSPSDTTMLYLQIAGKM